MVASGTSLTWRARVREGGSAEAGSPFMTAGPVTSRAPAAGSAIGRFVVFSSTASDLVEGDTVATCQRRPAGAAEFSCQDVVLFDRNTDEITMVSCRPDGTSRDAASGRSAKKSRVNFSVRSLARGLAVGPTKAEPPISPIGGPWGRGRSGNFSLSALILSARRSPFCDARHIL